MHPELLPAAAAVLLPFLGAGLILAVQAVAGLSAASSRDARIPVRAIALACTLATAALAIITWRTPQPATWRVEWLPGSGIGFGLHVDALSSLLGLVVALVALLAVTMSIAYVAHSREGRGRSSEAAFYGGLLTFTGAILGVAFAADLVQLFVLWELAEIASFLLIGLNWRAGAARARALRVLVITTVGGLVLLTGIICLGAATGTYAIAELRTASLPGTPLTTVALVLIVAGAAVKAAQFPLQTWLADAMAAPVPVNALVDSAALLAASVYLLLRLEPAFAAEPLWAPLLIGIGATSVLAGGVLALRARTVKIVLACSTVSQYGLMFILIGVGTATGLAAAVFLLVQHAALKAGLFMVTGAVGVLAWRVRTARWRTVPLAFVAALVLALSLAGVPPLGGFWSKELLLHVVHDAHGPLLLAVVTAGSVLTVAYMLRVLRMLFLDARPVVPAVAVAGAPSTVSTVLMIAPPLLLAGFTVLAGLNPQVPATAANLAAATVSGLPAALAPRYSLGGPLLLSLAALAVGGIAFALASRVTNPRWYPRVPSAVTTWATAARAFDAAGGFTLRLQNGRLRRYVVITWLGLLGLLVVAVPSHIGAVRRWLADDSLVLHGPGILDWHIAPLLVLAGAGTVMTLFLRHSLHYVLALGAVGYVLAGVFGLALAPSLGILQVHVETLVALLFLLLLTQIPDAVRERFTKPAHERTAPLHVVTAVAVGIVTAWLSWVAIEHQPAEPIAVWFTTNAPELTGSRDVVTAVLVHFRALDTLGEIVVFATAAAGVFVLARLVRKQAG